MDTGNVYVNVVLVLFEFSIVVTVIRIKNTVLSGK